MEVYIEYVIIDNLIIDYLIVSFVGMILSLKFRRINKVLSVLFGVVAAVVLPLFTINVLYLFLIKIAVGFVMVLILKKYANFRSFLTTCIVLFTITFLFGGMCLGVNSMFGLKTTGGQLLINGFSFPVSIFIVFASVYLYLLMQLVRYIKHRNTLTNFYFDVRIKQNSRDYFLRGYLDSGNKLLDGDNPVVVIPLKSFMRIFKDYPIERIVLGDAPNNPHYINTVSVNDKNKILVLEIDEIYIKNNQKNKVYTNVKLGISKVNFSSDFDLLLHSSL